jgi:proteasome assembly chaperone (PAC2) family protein
LIAAEAVEIYEHPGAKEIYMVAGWRQWADAGSVSSGLPKYLIQRGRARQIGRIRPDGFYMFQIPGTHDLIRPMVKFNEGYPEMLDAPENNFFYFEKGQHGVVVFLGEEPHMDIERYINALLDAAQQFHVKRIIGVGGVYGEFPYEKERTISANYSLHSLREEVEGLSMTLSDYQGGASIGSYLCKRAGEREIEYIGMYAMVPIYDFSNISQIGQSIQIENDYVAWLGIMRRLNYMFKMNFNLNHLAQKSQRLVDNVANKVEQLADKAPQSGVREYFQRLSAEFEETPFIPLDDVWEQSLRRIFNRLEDDEEES